MFGSQIKGCSTLPIVPSNSTGTPFAQLLTVSLKNVYE